VETIACAGENCQVQVELGARRHGQRQFRIVRSFSL
jgi:hypothetical protein